MAQAHVNPAELRRLARDLTRFSSDLHDMMSALHARMVAVEKTWHDQEQAKFAEEFSRTMKSLGRFFEASDAHVGFLKKKAKHIEDYFQQR